LVRVQEADLIELLGFEFISRLGILYDKRLANHSQNSRDSRLTSHVRPRSAVSTITTRPPPPLVEITYEDADQSGQFVFHTSFDGILRFKQITF